ncbi:hypothetical protein F4X33_20955 [Candidatus Poribacteria bacterium]|nr:hypothetical protein [Candidatus Poribacteria bacterium]
MKSNQFLRETFGVTLSILLGSFFFIGCGASEDDNNQPSIGTISDKTLNVGDKRKVEVTITDADVDNMHTVNASSDNMTVATVSVRETTLTVTGVEVGNANITVSATDDSGQDNAAAVPLTFGVTVNEPPPSVQIGLGVNQPPSSFIDKGACTVGMTLQPGEGCHYDNDLFAELVFFVDQDGNACREQVPKVIEGIEAPEDLRPRKLKFCVEWDIERDDFFETRFTVSKNPDGSWTIEDVP